MSYNALCACAELGIKRVVQASSVNVIGLSRSALIEVILTPQFTPSACRSIISHSMKTTRNAQKTLTHFANRKLLFRPLNSELTIRICELQAESICRRYPEMRIASLRLHGVLTPDLVSRERLNERGGYWKDLWGWVSQEATADSCLKGLLAPLSAFPNGHEAFFIASRTICEQRNSWDLYKTRFDLEKEGTEVRRDIVGNQSFFDTTKAERMLGWKEEGFMM